LSSDALSELGVRLSVLTPNYNYARFLVDTIASVQALDVAGVEHVVVDDGSVDDTNELLAAAPPELVWRIEAHRGQCAALNSALALATGDWIGWLNSDEFYLPGAFDVLAEGLAEHPDADLVYGDAVFVDVDGRVLRLVAQHSFSSRVLRWNRCNIQSAAMFMRRSAIPERGWDTALKATMDWDLFLDLWKRRKRFVYVPIPVAAFRVHPEQITYEQIPADHPDFPVLWGRHGYPEGWKGVVANRAGELEHRVLKVVEGGLGRERRVRAFQGADVRWFLSPEAHANASAVVAAGSGRPRDRVDAEPS
jgi:glycosyltransferase involved in cell wall biosynthesis